MAEVPQRNIPSHLYNTPQASNMNRRHSPSKNTSSESINLHSTGAGIRKSNSRSRRRTSPHWSEEAVRGSCTPGIPIPANTTTLTQETFNAWMEAQRTYEGPLENALPQTPDDAAAVDEWLGIIPAENDSAGLASDSRPWSSYPVSSDISPITAPDYTYSPATTAFTGMPALMPHAPSYSPLPFASTNPSVTSFQPNAGPSDFAFLEPDPMFQHDLLGIGSFIGQQPNVVDAGQRPTTYEEAQSSPFELSATYKISSKRPLRYKPLSTWFHLWFI